MATTTNFGWETPDDTDLVKDGAAAMRTLGNSIDTSFVDLKGGTSGQVLSKASNTDLDYTWVTPEIGDITAITVTSPITGGGTSGSVGIAIQDATTSVKGAVQLTDSTSSTSTTTAATPNSVKTSYDLAAAAVPKSTVTTAGDVIYATGSGAVTRLGLGTAGQVLTVNAGATAPEWATASGGGGWTSIASGSLSGSSLDLTSISGSYKNLQLVLRNCQISSGCEFQIRLNNLSTGIYNGLNLYNNNGTFGNVGNATATSFYSTYANLDANTTMSFQLDLNDYANTTSNKMVQIQSNYVSSGNPYSTFLTGACRTTSAVSRITVFPSAGTFSAGTYILYGAN